VPGNQPKNSIFAVSLKMPQLLRQLHETAVQTLKRFGKSSSLHSKKIFWLRVVNFFWVTS